MATNELCDFCWDDRQEEVPAVAIEGGVPLCQACRSTTATLQTRFKESKFPKSDHEEMTGAAAPEPKAERNLPMLSKEQIIARRDNVAPEKPTSIELFKPGGNEEDFAKGLGSLMRDVLSGAVDIDRAEAACKVADKVIRLIELRHKLKL